MMDDEPIKGVIAIAVDEEGKWVAMGGDNDPDAKESANGARDCLYDTGHVGMIQVYLKPVEFWPATVHTLGDKPLFQNVNDSDVVGELENVVDNLLGDCEVQLRRTIANTLERLKSLVRLHSYVAGEVSYYESDTERSDESSVQEAIAMMSGKPSAIAVSRVERSVERKVEQIRKETVTVTSEAASAPPDDRYEHTIAEIEKRKQANAIAADEERDTSGNEQPAATGLRTWDGVTDDEIADFLTPKAKKGVEIARHFGLSRNGMDARLRKNDRVMNSHVWWKLRPLDGDTVETVAQVDDDPEPEAEPETNGTTAGTFNPDITSRAGERPVETPPARLSSRQVEIKPCDKCGGPLGDGIRPFVCPVCDKDMERSVDGDDECEITERSVDHSDPKGYTAVQIASYVRQRLRQSSNGMMLIADIAAEMGVGQAAVADVVQSMLDVSHTGTRVIQKLVK